jgi:hypothetical protein
MALRSAARWASVPAKNPSPGSQVTSEFDAEAAGLEVADTFFDVAILEGLGWRGPPALGCRLVVVGGFDRFPGVHGSLLQPQGSR